MIDSFSSYFTAQEARLTGARPRWAVSLGNAAGAWYDVPQAHLLAAGDLNMSRDRDFAALIAGNFTFTLDNRSGLYSPNSSMFVFYGEDWLRLHARLYLGYMRPGRRDLADKVLLFEGLVTSWRLATDKSPDSHAPAGFPVAEITILDLISVLAERYVGPPDDNGYPDPLVCGTVHRSALALNNSVFWSEDEAIDYETADLTQWDHTEVNGAGAMAASGTSPYEGDYCCQHDVSGAGDDAYGRQDVGGATGLESMHISARLKFDIIPGTIVNYNYAFMGVMNTGAGRTISVSMNADGALTLSYWGITNVTADWLATDYEDIWVKLDLIIQYGTQGYVRLLANGEEIAVLQGYSIPKTNLRYGYVGLDAVYGSAATWRLWSDDVKMYAVGYPLGYYLPGGAYTSIDSVYSDVTILPQKKVIKPVPKYFANVGYEGGYWMGQLLIPGNAQTTDNYEVELTYGLVNFNGLIDKPTGSVSFRATKNSITHPVDMVEAVLTAVGLGSYINADSFAAAKADRPDEVAEAYFDNVTAAEAISMICGPLLYNLCISQGLLSLQPYTGFPPNDYVMVISAANRFSLALDISQENLRTGVAVTWGWYNKDPNLYYKTEDEDLKAYLGDQLYELDLTYGSDVAIGDEVTAKTIADLLLKRLSGGVEVVTIIGTLSLARLELGDPVLLQCDFNDMDYVYQVCAKTISLQDKVTTLTLERYLGEV